MRVAASARRRPRRSSPPCGREEPCGTRASGTRSRRSGRASPWGCGAWRARPGPRRPRRPSRRASRASEARTRAPEDPGGASSPRSRRCARRAGARTASAPACARARGVGEAVSACRARTRRDARGSKREESESIRGGGTGREEARRAVRAGEARARTSSGSPASAIAALALVRGCSRGGSTCACALGCGAGEQPEEYRIFSRKTKLSHRARQLCSKPVAARLRAGAARVRARDPAREGAQRAVTAPRGDTRDVQLKGETRVSKERSS